MRSDRRLGGLTKPAGFDLAATEAGLGNLVDCAQQALREAPSAIARAEECGLNVRYRLPDAGVGAGE